MKNNWISLAVIAFIFLVAVIGGWLDNEPENNYSEAMQPTAAQMEVLAGLRMPIVGSH